MRLRRTTAHEIDCTLPRISGEYLNAVVPLSLPGWFCLLFVPDTRFMTLIKVTWNIPYSIRNFNYVDFVLIPWRSYEEESAYST